MHSEPTQRHPGRGGVACLAALCLAALVAALSVPAPAQAATKPAIGPLWSTEVVATSAKLHTEINPKEAATTYHFNYITLAAYEANLNAGHEGFAGALKAPAGSDPSLGAGSSAVPVSQSIGALSPETAYRYRVVAANGEGQAESEPFAFTTQALGGSSLLLDNRAWEMVSPVEKNGGAVAAPETLWGGGVLQAAANGEAATFSSSASFGEGASGAPPASQYLSRRTASGWITQNITPPTLSGAYGDNPNGVPYQLFSGDLARGLMLNGRRCEPTEPCPRSYSLWEGGALTPLPAQAAGMRVLGASPDLGRILFEDEAGEVFEWSGGGLVPVSPPPPSTGVLGESADGSVVYYQDGAGLFVSREGTTTEIAPGPEAAQSSDYPPGAGTARVSPDGTHLAFLSKQSLTGYDNTDQATGKPDSEVFLYQAEGGGGGTLTCASCNPTGERPIGPSTIPGAIANGSTRIYKPRALSANGKRLFFDSADSLVLQDTDGAPDVYEWEAQGEGSCARPGGCLALVSSGRTAASFVDASASGSDAFFLTAGSLVPSDPGSLDLYDARIGGGFPEPPSPIACEGDACQSLPPEPEDPLPGTLQPAPGNPPLPATRPARRCRRGFVKRHGRCVRKRHHRKRGRR